MCSKCSEDNCGFRFEGGCDGTRFVNKKEQVMGTKEKLEKLTPWILVVGVFIGGPIGMMYCPEAGPFNMVWGVAFAMVWQVVFDTDSGDWED